ncbi:PKD domain-containing protein [Desulfosediminicola ganghwensis]|uniref:PKD domain-containing protein n=1 Tax=Desulfosediminicola ganghwensis TaxID=2569540 RepID=UPI0010AB5549|nr:PKD domain-containing protein [Desulfosediminicola ganghwensis]
MKTSRVKALIRFCVIIGLVLVNCAAHATDVAGVIDTDTTWDLAGSPYIVTGGILVNPGTTLTIEAGVQVRFNGLYILTVQGNIRTLGTQGNEIIFTSNFIPQQKDDWVGIRLLDNIGSEINGTIIEYSKKAISLEGGSDNRFYNNVFRNCSEAIGSWDANNTIANNNYFYNISGAAFAIGRNHSIVISNNTIENVEYGVYINEYSTITINNTNMLNVYGYSVKYTGFQDSQDIVIDGRYNYWDMETTAEMDLKGATANIDNIWDFYDNPLVGRVDYSEWLHAPNPNAYPWLGVIPVNQSPIAKAGADQVVFDTVTLDGSASYDPDGSVVSHYWELVYRGDAAHDMTTNGVNPTITDLYPGFYDAYLTVTDDEGATSTDTSVVAAAGPSICTASTIHVGSITASTLKGSQGRSYGEVTVTLFDDYFKPVAGATVTGTFAGDFNETLSGVSDNNGVVVIRTTEQVKKPLYGFCVNSVDKESLLYVPEDNIETCTVK